MDVRSPLKVSTARRYGGIQPPRAWFGPPRTGSLRNPTVWLFAASTALVSTGTAGYLSGFLPPWTTVLVNALGLYLGFTVLHDGVHGVVHPNPRIGNSLARVWGFLLTFTFPFFRSLHLEHHRFANDPARDPDMVTAQLPAPTIPIVGGFFVFASYHAHYFRRRLWRSRAELAEVVACDLFYLGVLAAAFAGGWTLGLLILWIGPLTLTILFLVVTFDYLPHRPHDSLDPLFSSRAYGGAVLTAVLCGQNHHLIHHLWPRIPWFRYHRAFRQVQAELRARGCRVGWRLTPLPEDSRRRGEPR